MMLSTLIKAVRGQPKPPCTNCYLRERCASQGLACLDFSKYVHNHPYAIYNANREPTRERYLTMFKGEGRWPQQQRL